MAFSKNAELIGPCKFNRFPGNKFTYTLYFRSQIWVRTSSQAPMVPTISKVRSTRSIAKRSMCWRCIGFALGEQLLFWEVRWIWCTEANRQSICSYAEMCHICRRGTTIEHRMFKSYEHDLVSVGPLFIVILQACYIFCYVIESCGCVWYIVHVL